MAEQSTGDFQTKQYNGQTVLTDPRYIENLNSAVADYNKEKGTSLSAKDYDYMLNPTTAGARWGDAVPATGTGSTGGGLLTPQAPTASNPAAAATTTVPTTAAVATYNPTKQTVSPESLASNQLSAITATGSQLTDQAKAQAQAAANRRGLLNSSIAAEAGQQAVLNTALPLAQQNASTYANADTANAQYSNAAPQFNAAAQNTANLAGQQASLSQRLAEIQASTTMSVADKQIAAQKAIADSENANKMQLQQLQSDTQKALANMDTDSKTKLAQIDADNRQLLQTNISAANIYAQYAQAVSQILQSKDMDAAAKQAAVDNQLAIMQQTLKAIGQVSGLDLSKYLQSAGSINGAPPATVNSNPDYQGTYGQ